ncbi:PEX13-like protein [Mya arenaria]|uniref:Peroxisomal membrane protein PEX13 n=1 Tax=Mya arenaria TaxID=6604 RepID=A0ABY7FPW1_MYAAR|nr:peroxisomal membrane protein PEX13-like [Mya arenaria]WAR24245.1 PEX13-like protein [Mya arenaria]
MAAPLKPWEKAGVNRQMDETLPSTYMSGGTPAGFSPLLSGSVPTIGGGDSPPPVPSRPTQTGQYSSYSSGYGGGYGGGTYGGYGGGLYSSPYSSSTYGYGSGMYGSSMYGGGYGGYGMNRYGQQNEFNSFSRMAEESSRPAFQSIESIVGAFSSVSMMLDSTFQAVYNSFRAVVGVADNFSRMKMQFGQIFSAFAIFRTIRYLYRKLLVLLRLRPQGYAEEAWVEAGDTIAQASAGKGPGNGKSSWPVLMFFAIIMGGPWLIWKFLQSTFSGATGQGWATGEEDHFVAKAVYNYEGQGNDELSFKAGDNILVAPKELQPRMKGWLLASVDSKTIGIVPANYVKVLGRRRGTKVSNYPVNNELESFSEQASNQTRAQPHGSMPLANLPSTNDFTNQSGVGLQSIHQSPSAMNFENQMQTNLYSEASLDTTNPSDPVLGLVEEMSKDEDNSSQ